MIKTRLTGGSVLVTFELPGAAAAAAVSVCGDFNDWSPTSHQLTRTDNGSFQAALELPAGRRRRHGGTGGYRKGRGRGQGQQGGEGQGGGECR